MVYASLGRTSRLLLLLAISAGLLASDGGAPPPVAAKFLGLFDRLRTAEAQGKLGHPQHIAFELFESDINDYIKYALKTVPRPGLESVTVKVFPHNYISTFVLVDFDAVERWRPGTIPALLKVVLSGKKSIWVDCRFQTTDSKAVFSVEKAYYQNIRLPAFLVAQIIKIIAARQPEKYDTSKPLTLPFWLKQVWTADHSIHGQN
jgi:hypothetical protein